MVAKIVAVALVLLGVVACGEERPDPKYFRKSTTESATDGSKAGANQKNGKKTQGTSASTTPGAPQTGSTASDPGKGASANPPAGGKLPLRTTANAAEIAAAKTAYGSDCAGCHQPLATSAKKGRTAAQIETALTVPAHQMAPGLPAKWPKDVKDTSDDGVDSAMLKASAMAEALK